MPISRPLGALRRVMACVAMAAQFAMVLAPLADVGEGSGAIVPVRSIVVAMHGGSTVSADHGQPAPHNPLTCPACVAQSIHARPEAVLLLPSCTVGDEIRIDRCSEHTPHADPLSTLHSRAPPVVG